MWSLHTRINQGISLQEERNSQDPETRETAGGRLQKFPDPAEARQTASAGYPFRNLVRPADVNFDGGISPVDALLIINYLNAYGSRTVAQAAQACRDLIDVDGDGFVAPADAMAVINELNALRPAGLQTAPTAGTSGLNAAAVDAYVAESLDGVPESILTGRPGRRGR